MCTSNGTVSIEFVGAKERKQKGGYEYRAEHKTRSARNTDRHTGREESIHIRHRLIEKGEHTVKCVEQKKVLLDFLGFLRPNLVTGLSGWRASDYHKGPKKLSQTEALPSLWQTQSDPFFFLVLHPHS